tara:strand:- start:220 stop:408 length:189 start_codon:yes stop_codon:yes gene_type:complete
MKEQYKQQVRVYLRPKALKRATNISKSTGQNLSEVIEEAVNQRHFHKSEANGANTGNDKSKI